MVRQLHAQIDAMVSARRIGPARGAAALATGLSKYSLSAVRRDLELLLEARTIDHQPASKAVTQAAE